MKKKAIMILVIMIFSFVFIKADDIVCLKIEKEKEIYNGDSWYRLEPSDIYLAYVDDNYIYNAYAFDTGTFYGIRKYDHSFNLISTTEAFFDLFYSNIKGNTIISMDRDNYFVQYSLDGQIIRKTSNVYPNVISVAAGNYSNYLFFNNAIGIVDNDFNVELVSVDLGNFPSFDLLDDSLNSAKIYEYTSGSIITITENAQ